MDTSRKRNARVASIAVCAAFLWIAGGPRAASADQTAVKGLESVIVLAQGNLRTLAAHAASTLSSYVDTLPVPSVLGMGRHGHRRRSFVARAGIRHNLRESVLNEYVRRVRHVASYARVTSDFNDYRPGRRHNGYDIGLDAGTPVPCGWSGRVTKLTPWYGPEYGITVESNGIEVTYGHLMPSVKVGDELQPGDVVGRVAYDHVDIKMYTVRGYVDWGKCNPFADPVLTALRATARARVSYRDLARAVKAKPQPRVTYSSAWQNRGR